MIHYEIKKIKNVLFKIYVVGHNINRNSQHIFPPIIDSSLMIMRFEKGYNFIIISCQFGFASIIGGTSPIHFTTNSFPINAITTTHDIHISIFSSYISSCKIFQATSSLVNGQVFMK